MFKLLVDVVILSKKKKTQSTSGNYTIIGLSSIYLNKLLTLVETACRIIRDSVNNE